MKIGIRIPPCAPVNQLAEFAREVEAAGFDAAWFPDSQLLWRDPYLTILASQRTTSRLRLGTAVTNVETRHVTVIASLLRTVAEAAPGRVRVGVGVGASSVVPIGLTKTTNDRLRRSVGALRSLLAGDEWATDHGRAVKMTDPPPGRTEIFLAATGPRRLALAGEVADGVILHCGTSPRAVEEALKHVERGATLAGRSLADIQVVVSGVCHAATSESATDVFAPIYMTMLQDGGASALRAAGLPAPAIDPTGQDFKHAANWRQAVAEAGETIDEESVARFADEFCFAGTADRILGRFRELESVGVQEVFCQGLDSFDLPHDLVTALSSTSTGS